MSEDSTISRYLAAHPRMLGALFTLLVLLNTAGTVVGGPGSATAGP